MKEFGMIDFQLANRRDSERITLKGTIEFAVDSGDIDGESIDVSQSGISFETNQPITVEMILRLDGEEEARRAKVIWSKQLPTGRLRYGLKFLDDGETSS
jgi:hypothetical protein